MTIQHKMSRKMSDFHVHVFIFSERKFYAIYIDKTNVQIRGLMAAVATFF